LPTTFAFANFRAVPKTAVYNARSSAADDGDDASTAHHQPHIVIVGGGFGGINSALTLPTLPWSDAAVAQQRDSGKATAMTSIKPKITLIDKSERFVFLPLLYELCVDDASIDEVAPTFKSLLSGVGTNRLSTLSGLPDLSDALQLLSGTSNNGDETTEGRCEVSFLQAQVEGIDANNNQVVVSRSAYFDGNGSIIETIDYDALIISTGAEISCNAVPGASKFALPFYTVEQCFELKRRLALIDNYLEKKYPNDQTEKETSVVVVGGGYAGVELALNLVDRLGSNVQVTLVHRGKHVLEYATDHNRNVGEERLESAGVNVMTSTSVDEVTPWDGPDSDNINENLQKQRCIVKLSTTNGPSGYESERKVIQLPTTLLLWTAGSTPTSVRNTGIRNSVLPRDSMGRIVTSPTLNVLDYPNIFAIGDCSRPKQVPYPATAQVAMQMATVASWNVYATLVNTYVKKYCDREQDPVKLLPFSYLNLGEMMTLGTNDATISTLGGIELSGPAASWLRRLVYAVRMPTPGQGFLAAVDGSRRKLVRGAFGSVRRKSKPVDWK
jgi:NADH dehydrogenase